MTWRFLIALVVLVFFLFPVYWLFITSIKSAGDIFARPPVWFPNEPNFRIFGILFKDGDVWAIYNSLIIASVSTVVAMVLGTAAAYSLARFKTGGQNLAIWIISQRMIRRSYVGLILLYIAFNLPYVIWMMRGYIEDIPVEVEESALTDGCSRWQALRKIVFPMARTGIFATAVFTFIFAWNEFVFALILTRHEVLTFPVLVTHYYGAQSTFWAKIAALSVLGTLPVFFAVATLQRFLVRGITMGAVKG
ncbi:Diacetylchitobiose uptake system permease protein DasC [Geodia barretti]|uniref:Diacetylchitobiose uptake system permease protein DasC n=1 Tax=Geodia barretti TaxID=519541 RepID=A0AA35X6B0_GEOBA|nr:Diacetylchitobiose uptake system permease protein DasC [Geodia barretti]